MTALPKDPMILLSFVNTQLRDHYPTLAAFVDAYETDETVLREKLSAIDYVYDEERNQFV